jgi:hypothetical protein
MPVSMTAHNNDDESDSLQVKLDNFLYAEARALAIHEAGHAVVARALGANVVSVVVNFRSRDRTGDGKTTTSGEFADHTKNLAVCVAGCRAEHTFESFTPRKMKKGDYRQIRRLLLQHFAVTKRRAARAKGYRDADETLTENRAVVLGLADALLARRSNAKIGAKARIEGAELAVLLAGVGPA